MIIRKRENPITSTARENILAQEYKYWTNENILDRYSNTGWLKKCKTTI